MDFGEKSWEKIQVNVGADPERGGVLLFGCLYETPYNKHLEGAHCI